MRKTGAFFFLKKARVVKEQFRRDEMNFKSPKFNDNCENRSFYHLSLRKLRVTDRQVVLLYRQPLNYREKLESSTGSGMSLYRRFKLSKLKQKICFVSVETTMGLVFCHQGHFTYSQVYALVAFQGRNKEKSATGKRTCNKKTERESLINYLSLAKLLKN